MLDGLPDQVPLCHSDENYIPEVMLWTNYTNKRNWILFVNC